MRAAYKRRHRLTGAAFMGTICLVGTAEVRTLCAPVFRPQQQNAPANVPSRSPQVQTLLDKGEQERVARNGAEALEMFGQALTLARSSGDRAGEAAALAALGLVQAGMGQPEDALTSYRLALTLERALGRRAEEAVTLNNMGKAWAGIGRREDALDCCRQAVALFHALGDTAGEAVTLNNLGLACANADQPAQAMAFYQQALPLMRASSSKAGEASLLNNMGNAYVRLDQPDRAMDAYSHALPLLRALDDRSGEAATLNNMGNVYANTGQSTLALDSYQQALKLEREPANREGRSPDKTTDTTTDRTINNTINRTTDNTSERTTEANTLAGIGGVYALLGEPARALDDYMLALPLFRELGSRAGVAATLNNIGGVYSATGQPARALICYQQALPLEREIGNSAGEAATFNNIGNVCADMGYNAQALASYQNALAVFRAVGGKAGEAATLTYIGSIYAQSGQPALALDAYRQALPIQRYVGDRAGEASTLNNIALADARLSHPERAEASFQQAIARLEQMRRDLGRLDEAKVAFTENNLSAYRGYLDLLLKQKRVDEAFALAQQTKSRTVLELLASGRADLTARLSDDERRQLATLSAACDTLNRQMISEGARNEIGGKKRFEAMQEQLGKAERDLSAYTDTLYARHPDLAQARAIHTLTGPEAAALLPPGTALLEYATRQGAGQGNASLGLVLFVLTPDGRLTAHDVPAPLQQIQTLAANFRAACANPRLPYGAQGAELYRLLLAPAQARLAGSKHLLVCPDGPLWNVPFAAMGEGEGRFIADRYAVTYAYSATGAAAALSVRTRPRATGSVLALANPDFGNATRFGDDLHLAGQRPFDAPSRPFDAPARPFDAPARPFDAPSRPFDAPSRPFDAPSRDLMSQLRGGGIVPLPGTQAEADTLHRLYPDAMILTGKNAQEGAFKRMAGQYRILHLASHAFFNDAAPLLSCVFLAAPPASGPGSDQDGYLTARELIDMKLNAELVTLSACQTAQGATHAGEGVIGLTWALTVAGVPTQVVSQWSVDDNATATLMQGFYTRLQSGMGKGDALHQAAFDVRRDERHRHPYYWAPFVLLGEWR